MFTLHGKDFALKLDPFPTICNAMLPHFPSPHCSIACWENFEWNWKVNSGYLHGAKVFQEFQLKELIGHQVFQFRFEITGSERKTNQKCSFFLCKNCIYSAPKLFVSEQEFEWDLSFLKLVWYVLSYNGQFTRKFIAINDSVPVPHDNSALKVYGLFIIQQYRQQAHSRLLGQLSFAKNLNVGKVL